MKNYIIHIAFGALLLMAACSKETELKKSVFIPDTDFPDLPAYSEWGYNTFGAYYDRELFIYTENDVPAKIINTGGKTSFLLKGQKRSAQYSYDYDPVNMSISFDLYGFQPNTFSDLLALHDTTIDLTGPNFKMIVTIDTVKHEEQIMSGTLKFIRAQQLMVDKNQVEVILSGEFGYTALVDEEPISITLGRFDVGIGEDNFFKY